MFEIGVDPGQQLFDPGVLKGRRAAVGKHFRLLADEEQHPGNSGADLKLIACLFICKAQPMSSYRIEMHFHRNFELTQCIEK